MKKKEEVNIFINEIANVLHKIEAICVELWAKW